MENKFYAILIFGFLSHFAKAQYVTYDDYFYTQTRQPASTRAEAMGYAGVANGGTVQETRMNAASLGVSQNPLLVEFSSSSPIFIDKRADLTFIGVGFRLHKKWFASYHEYRARIFNTILGFKKGNQSIQPNFIRENNHLLNLVYKVNSNLSFGVNGTLFDNHVDSAGLFHSFIADIGALWNKNLLNPKQTKMKESTIRLGASISNINSANTYYHFKGIKDTNSIYGLIRLGFAYFVSKDIGNVVYGKSAMIPKDSRTIDWLLQGQYVKFFNGLILSQKDGQNPALRWGYNLGTEISVFKVLFLRAGYRFERRQGSTSDPLILNYPYLKGFTFGFGIKIPFHYLTTAHLPFDLMIDVCHQKPFKWISNNIYYPTHRTTGVSLRINWFLNKSNAKNK